MRIDEDQRRARTGVARRAPGFFAFLMRFLMADLPRTHVARRAVLVFVATVVALTPLLTVPLAIGGAGVEVVYADSGTPQPTSVPAATNTPVPPSTNTPVPPPTNTPAPPPTNTPAPPPTNTPVPPPANTPVPPTNTPVPPTATHVPPTNTPVPPPTSTPVPSTATPVPPTNTPVPPTNTPVPPTATPVPPAATTTVGAAAPIATTSAGSSAPASTNPVQNAAAVQPSSASAPSSGTTTNPTAPTTSSQASGQNQATQSGAGSPSNAGSAGASTDPASGGTGSAPSSNTSNTTTASGNGAVTGALAQTGLVNGQTSVAQTGGGQGLVTAANSNTGSVKDTGTATGQTGLSAAEGAGATATLLSGSGVAVKNASNTNAVSGGASATGLVSQTGVLNNAVGVAQVGGASTAPVSVTNTNTVTIQNVGVGDVASGQALAKGGSAVTNEGSVVTGAWSSPSAATGTGGAGSNQSASASNTGAVAQNVVNASSTSTINATGHNGDINVNQTQAANLKTIGQANASSDNTCAGGVCSAATPTPAPGASAGPTASGLGQVVAVQNESNTSSNTGDASSRGTLAQNGVTTSADARVHVGGSNFAPIQIIIQTFTNILNVGVAGSYSGTASATGGQAIANVGGGDGAGNDGVNHVASALSGDAHATGVVVSNNVQLGSSSSVNVQGDNHDTINLFAHLIANIWNWGGASATTGNAHSNGYNATTNGGGRDGSTSNASTTFATSGNADTLGLSAQNAVYMWAQAFVNISGSNYAPITLTLLFETDIVNYGQAISTTGDAKSVGGDAVVNTGNASSGVQSSNNQVNNTTTNQSPSQTNSQVNGAAVNTGATSSSSAKQGDGNNNQNSSNTSATSGKITLSAMPLYPTDLAGSGQAGSYSNKGGSSSSSSSSNTIGLNGSGYGSFDNTSNTASKSGSGQALGLNSQFSAVSGQVAVAQNPQGRQYTTQTSSNNYTYTTTGIASMTTGDALVGPTPTPTPTAIPTSTPSSIVVPIGQTTDGSSGADSGGTTGGASTGGDQGNGGSWPTGLTSGNGGTTSIVQGSNVDVNMSLQWQNDSSVPMPDQLWLTNWPNGGFTGGGWPNGLLGVGGQSVPNGSAAGGNAGRLVDGVFTRPDTNIYGSVGEVDPLGSGIVPSMLPMPEALNPSAPSLSSNNNKTKSWWSLAPTYPGRSRLDLVVSELLLAMASAALVWMKLGRSENRLVWVRGVVQYGLGLFVLLVAFFWRK